MLGIFKCCLHALRSRKMSEDFKRTLRLNVSCNSRDKKFLVLGEKDNLISDFITAIKKMFVKLYPHEPPLEVVNLKNQDGFDVFPGYKLGDLFEDNACLDVIETDIGYKEANESSTFSVSQGELPKKLDTKDTSTGTQSLHEVKQEEQSTKKNTDDQEKASNEILSSSEHKRSHSDSDETEKRKKRHKNAKKKKSGKQ